MKTTDILAYETHEKQALHCAALHNREHVGDDRLEYQALKTETSTMATRSRATTPHGDSGARPVLERHACRTNAPQTNEAALRNALFTHILYVTYNIM